jgi:dolichol-phosphate mannosyltransferase
MKLSILLPSYKEGENLKTFLPKLIETLQCVNGGFEILVIDTNEPMDDTQKVCEGFSKDTVKYINRQNGNFYGDAVRTAILNSTGDLSVFMDADGQHPIEKIPQMLVCVDEGSDLIIGSRYVKGGKTNAGFISKLMSRTVNTIYRIFLHIKAKDISGSFRMYKTSMLKELKLECNNFDIIEEIIVKLCLYNKDLKIKEVPIKFEKRVHGKSKRKLIKFICSYLKTLFKLKRVQKQYRKAQKKLK